MNRRREMHTNSSRTHGDLYFNTHFFPIFLQETSSLYCKWTSHLFLTSVLRPSVYPSHHRAARPNPIVTSLDGGQTYIVSSVLRGGYRFLHPVAS